jgi:uncharacterized protein
VDGPVYVDSSALVKIYVPEPDSDSIEELLRRRRDLVISDLVVTEIVSAAARRMREGTLTKDTVGYLQQSILNDVESDRVRLVDLRSTTHRDAERILMTVDSVALRASDAIHLALVLESDCRSVMTFDLRLSEAARSVGISVYPENRI